MSLRRIGLLGAVLALLAGVLADRGRWWGELGTTQAANALPGPVIDALDVVMQLGTRPAVLLVALVAVVTSDVDWRRVALGVVLAGGLAWAGATVAKHVVERPRPAAVADDVTIRDDAEWWGWPSSHVAIATGSLTAAATFSRRRRAVALALAVGAVVGVARMAVGVHLPLDVIGGLGIGLAAAAIGVLVADR